MEPIQNISYSPANANAVRPSSASTSSPAAAVGGADAWSVAQVSSLSATESMSGVAISQQVDAFLGSISPTLANNAYLKLLIAALIMQVLLGEDGGAQQSGAGSLATLEALAGGRNTALFISIESSTNTVQLTQQSSRLDLTSAVQSLTESANGAEQPGRQMDVTG